MADEPNPATPDDRDRCGDMESTARDCTPLPGHASAPVTIVHNADAMLREVRAAHARGWAMTPVIGKAPFLTGWNSGAPLPIAKVERYAAKKNIAMRCGRASGVLVLDDDSSEQGAADLLSLPSTVTVVTGRGRRHYYFRMPDCAVPNKAKAFGIAVEVKSDGTAVLLPGATHPDTGGPYRWLEGHDPDSMPLAEFPQVLLDELLRPPRQLAPPRTGSRPTGDHGPLIERYAAEVRSAPEGERNHTLNKVAYFLGGIAGRGDLDAADIEASLLAAALDAGLTERESRATIASGLGKGIAAPLPRPSNGAHHAAAAREVDGSAAYQAGLDSMSAAPTAADAGAGAKEPPMESSGSYDGRRTSPARDARGPKKPRVGPSRPFPLHLMPEDVRGFCRAVAEARSVDVSMVATAVMVGLGSAIGLSRSAWDSYSKWSEPAAIWAALVMRSGGRKSPVLEDVFRGHHDRQAALHDAYMIAQEEYEREVEEYEHAVRSAAKSGGATKVPRKPKPPKLEHIYTTDATQEAMVRMLADTPRGVLAINDELAGFFGALGRYGNGKTDADRAFWLSMFRATSAKIDRATKGTIYVKRGLASIVGGVQPSILLRCFDEATFSSGLASRFLLVMPQMAVKEYRPGPSEEDERRYKDLLHALLGLGFATGVDAKGNPTHEPIRVPFSEDCRDFLRAWVPIWSAEALESSETVEAAMSKLEAYALRFALIFKTCREAQGTATAEDPIEERDLQAGAELARWYRDEAIRVYQTLGQELETEKERALEARVAVIRSRGGAVTVREWRQRNTRKSQAQAREELDDLVKADLAIWSTRLPSKRGGAATEECRLIEPSEPGDRDPGTGSDDPAGGDDTFGTGPEDLEIGTHSPRGPSGKSEVPLCTDVAQRASACISGDLGEAVSEVPVAGCVVQVPSAHPTENALLGPKNGGGSPATTGFEGSAHNTTPVSKKGLRDGAEARGGEASCTTHNATRNLASRSTSDVQVPDPLVEAANHPGPVDLGAAILEALPGSHEVGPATTVIPIEAIFRLTPAALGPCVRCGSTAYWRLRDAGRREPGEPRCLRCYPAHPGDEQVEFLNVTGGAA